MPRMGPKMYQGEVCSEKKWAEHSAASAFFADPEIQCEVANLEPSYSRPGSQKYDERFKLRSKAFRERKASQAS